MKKLIAGAAGVAVIAALTACGPTGSPRGAYSGSSGATNPYIAVVGDSYASGEGTGGPNDEYYIPPTNDGTFYMGGTTTRLDNCHRSSKAYAVTIFHVAPANFLACSGANYGDITQFQKNSEIYTSYRSDGSETQLERLLVKGGPNERLKTVIVSAGGDDANFAGIITACTSSFQVVVAGLPVGNPTACQPAINREEQQNFYGKGSIEAHLVTLYTDILGAAPGAHIYAVGYPHIFSPQGYPGNCGGITAANQVVLNSATDDLNTVVRRAAAQAATQTGRQVTFVDTTNVTAGHWVCGSQDGYINEVAISAPVINPVNGNESGFVNCLPKDITSYGETLALGIGVLGICSQSYHPTIEGSTAIGKKILQCMNEPSTCGLNPPLDAVAAWNATDNECASTVGASLRNVASLLPPGKGPAGDDVQIDALNQLAALPLSELGDGTPAQQAEGQADLSELNTFFGTSRTLTSFTGPCLSPSQSAAPAPSPGNDSPADAVDGFYQGELAGNWSGSPTSVCSFVSPVTQVDCVAGTAGQGEATGQVVVGQAEISGDEALVPVTGNICAPSSPCVTNDDASLGMPLSPEQFPAAYKRAVANGGSSSVTAMSPMPCIEVGGIWYVNFE